MNLTVMIPTFNEAHNIVECMNSVIDGVNILVVDSFSTDGTAELAKSQGATVIQHEYINSATQKNWALDIITSEWVLIVDADERLTGELWAEIETVVQENQLAGLYIPRKNFFLNRWIRHSDWYPDYNLRLFKPFCGRYEVKEVHAHVKLSGNCAYAQSPMLHYSYTNVDTYIKKLMKYTTWEAQERYSILSGKKEIDRSNFSMRMRMKYLWHFIPGKPIVRFLWMYVAKRGFMDGKQGFWLAVLSSFYDFVVEIKLAQIKQKGHVANETMH